MKVIDLLNKIANGEEVPEKIKVYNNIYVYDSLNKAYWNSNNKQLFEVHNGRILNYEVEIIDDEPEEKATVSEEQTLFNNLDNIDKDRIIKLMKLLQPPKANVLIHIEILEGE